MALAAGATFGPYRVVAPLGKGGMGAVYKVYEPGLDRHVALKILPAEFLHEETFAARFAREVKVVARLEHPSIVPIYGAGIEDGLPWMAMRLLPGGTLSSLLENGRLTTPRIVAILRGVASGLAYAHAQRIVHRDLKPQNVLLDDSGQVYLADFGLARILEGSTTALTRTGMVAGTPQYMAPEQALGQAVDHRADIYALGIIAYEMFTGRVPFTADTPMAVLMKHLQDAVPVEPLATVAEPARRAILRAVAKDVGDRWPSAVAFVDALQGLPVEEETIASGMPAADGESGKLTVPPSGGTGERATTLQAPMAPSAPEAVRPRRYRALALTIGAAAVAVAIALATFLRPRNAPKALPISVPVAAAEPESPQAQETMQGPQDGLEYVRIPSGSFEMGCVPDDSRCAENEKPRHHVEIPKAFWLGRTLVTVAAYKKYVAAAARAMPEAPPFDTGWSQEDHPITNVRWDDAAAFCAWAGGRLPTEAEWEYAARGGHDGRIYPWGASITHDEANYAGTGRQDRWESTSPVAAFAANDFGLHDMAGNVFQWCSDWYDPRAYASSGFLAPRGPARGVQRALRGGSWGAVRSSCAPPPATAIRPRAQAPTAASAARATRPDRR